MSKNSERPSGGRIVSVYFDAEELALIEELKRRLGLRKNTLIRQMVREFKG